MNRKSNDGASIAPHDFQATTATAPKQSPLLAERVRKTKRIMITINTSKIIVARYAALLDRFIPSDILNLALRHYLKIQA